MSNQGEASLSAVSLKLSNSIPDYMDLKSEREFTVLYGNTEYSRTIHSATNPSATSVNINCVPPSSDSLIHPIAWKKATWTLTFNVANTSSGPVFVADATTSKIILRANPLENIIQNEDLKINGNSFSVSNVAKLNEPLHRFANSVDDKINEYSLTPNQMDEFYSYNLGTLTNKDPFSAYGGMQVGESRYAFGSVNYTGALGNIADTANADKFITFTVMEPIKIAPMYYQPYALVGVKDMKYSATFANHGRMLCFKSNVTGVTYSNLRAKLDAFELHFAYSTPKLLSSIPNSVVYPYQYVDHYSQGAKAVADDNDYEIKFNTINLSGVPRKMIVWVSEVKSDILEFNNANLIKTDTSKAVIKNISITFANKQGILSEADEKDLFQISKKNGLLGLSYSQTKKWVGSYLSLNFGEEIPLPESLAPGTLGVPQLSFNVKFIKLPGSETRNYELNTAILYEGACTIIKNSSCIKQLSVLSTDDVINSLQKDYEMVHYNSYNNNNFGGRISGGSLLSVISSALPIARMIRGAIQKAALVAKTLADGAEKVGLGVVVKDKKGKKGGQDISRYQLNEEMY
jgi:hypothetical protein